MYMYLHFCSAWWCDFGIIHTNLSLWHLVETLVNNVETLSHLFHTTSREGGEGREEERGA